MNITNYMSSSANLLPPADTLTMSSREIAELVGSRHDKVKQSIDRLAERGLITFTPVGEKPNGGRPSTAYHVGKRDSFVIVAQLCPEFTARLVDRWMELEEQARTQVPMHYVISEQVRAEVERQIQHALSNQTHKLVIEYVSVGEILNMEKVPPKGRRGLVTASASRLRKFCERNGIIPRLMRTGCSERYVYNPDIVARWLAEEGRNLIRQYRDKRAGQGVLSFPRAVKKPSTGGGAS